MISTLINLGKQLSHDIDDWADVIDLPKIDPKKENLIATLVFDIDQQIIYPELSGAYQEKSPFVYNNVSIKGGNNKGTYLCCETDKLVQIEKTFFGKIDSKGKPPVKGEFQEYIDTKFPLLQKSMLYKVCQAVFEFREKFLEEKWNEPETINKILLGEDYKKPGSRSKLVLTYTSVISEKLGIVSATPVADLEGFETFIRLDRFTKPVSNVQKISYATGNNSENVISVAFPNRYSLNYMFVETTMNYASGFNKNNFHKNYQINAEEQLYLERASERLLNTQQISIAGIPHCIIPQFLSGVNPNLLTALEETYKKSELLFQQKGFEYALVGIRDATDEEKIYWINFLAFESDGNSFKTINLIKDVSKIHFDIVLQIFRTVDRQFKSMPFAVDWQDILSDRQNKEGKEFSFNLQTVYQIIPQRKDKEKKNEALTIFKAILEKRQVDEQNLFKRFTELVLCHKFGRYEAYKNVKRFGDDHFDFAVRDAVFKYLAFLTVLKKLKQSNNMEENNQQDTDEVISIEETTTIDEYQQKIEAFFTRMDYKDYQKALFYLGRMLSSVVYIQKEKKKTVLDKLNFNGMDKDAIQRLRSSMIEKALQYKEFTKVIFNDARFNDFFDYNAWKVNPHEALFFILNGYSFGIKTKKS